MVEMLKLTLLPMCVTVVGKSHCEFYPVNISSVSIRVYILFFVCLYFHSNRFIGSPFYEFSVLCTSSILYVYLSIHRPISFSTFVFTMSMSNCKCALTRLPACVTDVGNSHHYPVVYVYCPPVLQELASIYSNSCARFNNIEIICLFWIRNASPTNKEVTITHEY